jgi:GNAT superfamily N-acetyltransferase
MSEQVRPTVRPAAAADLDRVAGTLASAFAVDPVFSWLLPPGIRARDRRRQRIFEVDGARSRTYGGLWTSADGDAAAVWFPPGHWRPSTSEDWRELPAWLRISGRRMRAFQRVRSALFAHHGELPPHWYLLYLGTRPERQGQGLGAALLDAVLERCDAERFPAYLESSNPRNTPLYRRHGFTESGSVTMPAGCPPMVPMWRDPR